MRRIVILLIVLLAAPVLYFLYLYFLTPEGIDISSSQICIRNESGQTLIVSAEADSGAEITGLLSSGEELCAPSPIVNDTGKIRVLENEDAVEGCSRLARAGQLQTLLAYASLDNCKWAND